MTALYLIRHARSVGNANGRIQGVTDSPLDDVGRAQADALARSLATSSVDRLICSPQTRALETARAIQSYRQGLSLSVDERLRERDAGVFSGLSASQMRARTGLDSADLHVLEWQAPDGETAAQLRMRAESFLDDVRGCGAAHLAIVTHGTVLNALLLAALGMPATATQVFTFDNASITELHWIAGRWLLRSVNRRAGDRPFVISFAESWRCLAAHNNGARQSDDVEIAFWAAHAEEYARRCDAELRQPGDVVDAVLAHIQPSDHVLDIGAGVGRFTLPIARRSAAVTALDLSPDMLAMLSHRCARANIDAGRIRIMQGNVEALSLDAYDVVLAAWSLYRLRDPLRTMRKLVAATKRTLIVIDGDHADSSDDKHIGVCNYLYLAGLLRDAGARASVHVIEDVQTDKAVGMVVWHRPQRGSEAA